MGKWVAFASLGLWLFGAGLLVGRVVPVRHFERFGTSNYLFDASSGYVCRVLPTADPWDKYATPINPADAKGTSGLGAAWTAPDGKSANDPVDLSKIWGKSSDVPTCYSSK